jgi:phage shock protein C
MGGLNMKKSFTGHPGSGFLQGFAEGWLNTLIWMLAVIRLIWVVSVFFWGTGLLMYIIAAIIIPKGENYGSTVVTDEDGNVTYVQDDAETNVRSNSALFIGGILVVIGGLILLDKYYPFRDLLRIIIRTLRGYVWPLLLIFTGLIIILSSLRRRKS